MSTATLQPSNLTNAVLHLEEQVSLTRERLQQIPGELARCSQDLGTATGAVKVELLKKVRNLCDEASRLVAHVGLHAEQAGNLARMMPHGSTAAATGSVQTVDGGTGAAGVAGSGEDTGLVGHAVGNDATGTGIVGLSADDIDPADKRSSKHKDEEK